MTRSRGQSGEASIAATVGIAVLGVVVLAGTVLGWMNFNDGVESATAGVKPLPTETASTPVEPPVAVFFGDSYFNGSEFTTKDQSYGTLAGQRAGYQPVIAGAGGTGFVGDLSPDKVGNYPAQIASDGLPDVNDPALVVIEGGLNDVGQDPKAVQASAEKVLDKAGKAYPTATVVLVGPVDPNGDYADTAPITAALHRAGDAAGVTFIDPSKWLAGVSGAIGGDGVHPTPKGSKVLAAKLVPLLPQAG